MRISIFMLVVILVSSCGSSKSYTEEEMQAYQNLKSLVESKQLEITSNFASPMATSAFTKVVNSNLLGPGNTASNIDISSNSNKLTIKGDSISGFFPYFGEVQIGSGTPGSTHNGIEFKDIPKNYNMTLNDDKHTVNIDFRIEDEFRNTELYNVFITLYSNNRSNIQINSTNRTSIGYSGRVKPTEQESTSK